MQIQPVSVPSVGGIYATDHTHRVEKEEGSADAKERQRDHSHSQQEEKNADVPTDILELSPASHAESSDLGEYAVVYVPVHPSAKTPPYTGEIPLPGSRIDLQA